MSLHYLPDNVGQSQITTAKLQFCKLGRDLHSFAKSRKEKKYEIIADAC